MSRQEKNVMKTDISCITITVKTIIGYLITIQPQTNNNLFLTACTTTNNNVYRYITISITMKPRIAQNNDRLKKTAIWWPKPLI